MEATYRWTDYFSRQRHECRCELLARKTTTATIKLLGYGPNGRPPGSVMNVQLKSVGIHADRNAQNKLKL